MKHAKLLGAVIIAGVALMAYVCADMASATVLCKATETPCSEFNKWQVGTFADGSLKSSGTFSSTGGSIIGTCSEATISGTVEGSSGSATETPRAKGGPANVVWGGCNISMETIAGGEVEVHHIAGTDDGTVTASGFQTTTKIFGTSCTYTYGSGTDVGTLKGGTNPTLVVNEVIFKSAGSFICPGDVVVKGEMILTEPNQPVYVGSS